MQELTVYPTIIEKIGLEFEKELFDYLKLIDDIQKEDLIIIPEEFYTTNLNDFIWSKPGPELKTLIDYFIEVIQKKKITDKSYHKIFASLNEPVKRNNEAITGLYGNKYITNDKLFVNNIEEAYLVRVFYLSLATSFEELERDARLTFNNLIFLDNSFNDILSMGNLQETKSEIIRHLDVLNRVAHIIYIEENRNAHNTMLKLKSTFNINCSGIGSNQRSSEFRIKDTYKGIQVNPRCNAHTKLFNAHNNFRIYFSWENTEVEEGKIIIGSVGGHING